MTTIGVRKAIRAELVQRRVLDVEAKAHRARLQQLAEKRGALTEKQIAARNGVPLGTVLAIAHDMPWTEDEKAAAGRLARYDPLDDLNAIRAGEAAPRAVRPLQT